MLTADLGTDAAGSLGSNGEVRMSDIADLRRDVRILVWMAGGLLVVELVTLGLALAVWLRIVEIAGRMP
jgi:hypothetical protein